MTVSTLATTRGEYGRWFLLFFAAMYTFFFVGALFGWGPMQRMLESSGAFHTLCDSGDSKDVCVAQSTRIININFIAVTTNTVTPLIGQVIDTKGAPFVAYCMSLVAMSGAALLIVAAEYKIDHLYLAAFCMLGLATFTGSLLSVQVGLYFSGMTQVRVIMFLNALFDAGSVTYLLLWGIQTFFGYSFADVVKLYFVLAVILYSGGAFFWHTAVPEVEVDEPSTEETTQLLAEQGQEAVPDHSLEKEIKRESLRVFQLGHMDTEMLTDAFLSLRGGKVPQEGHAPLETLYGSLREKALTITDKEDTVTNPSTNSSDDKAYIPLAHRSAKDQLLSVPFLCLTLFFAISMTSCNWSLATAADYLASMGDDGTYLSIFTLMQPASILSLPVVDATVSNLGFGAAFQAVNILNFVYILIKLTVVNLNVQIIHFVMVAVVRCYLFAVTFSFLPSLLSGDAVGKGTGFLYMIGGLTSFANLPLSHLAARVGFGPPNFLYLCMVFPCIAMVRVVQKTIEKEKAYIK